MCVYCMQNVTHKTWQCNFQIQTEERVESLQL
uniref:Uncharacterized protein n=1 Tax=Anguilla anguilla TaxID=7936 RepID=A0A0E9W5S2_ANGAN